MSNYKRISEKIEEVKFDDIRTKTSLKWINVINPGKLEIKYLRKNYKFDLFHLKSSATSISSQRPMIFQGDGYLFLILHFPVLKEEKIVAGEINFFVGHGYLVTTHNNNLKALRDAFNLGRKNPQSFLSYSIESSVILLYELLDRLINGCYQLIDDNSIAINRIEELIFANEQDDAVRQILDLRRNIINIRRIVQNHKNIFQKLMKLESTLVERQAIKNYYDSLVEHSKRIWEMLDNQKEMIEVLNNTNESLLNDRMTDIMKTLTIFSVIVFPLSLLAGIFGMNTINMPLVTSPHGFWIIVVVMLISSLAMLLFFKKKHWI